MLAAWAAAGCDDVTGGPSGASDAGKKASDAGAARGDSDDDSNDDAARGHSDDETAPGDSEDAAVGASDGGSTGQVSTPAASCTEPSVRVTEVDVGTIVVSNEDEVALKPLAISAIAGGGSRISFMGADRQLHIATLRADDTRDTRVPLIDIAANDYGDLYADDAGGVVLVSRDAQGGGVLNCGVPSNLCGSPPSPAVPCFDMYMVRFDANGERWASKLTQSSSAHPPYLNGRTDRETTTFLWWYAHHGRIASDGSNFAAYYGAALSVSEGGCVNIHQGDQLRVVGPSGAIVPGGFDWGCSHSGYERVVWDPTLQKFATVCKNDLPTGGKSGRLAIAPNVTVLPVDLAYANVGDIVPAVGGGYWLTTSDIRTGQPAGRDGLADVHLLHFTRGAPDKNLRLTSDPSLNHRAPHLAQYGQTHLLAAWESAPTRGDLRAGDSSRKLYVQVLDAATGEATSRPLTVPVRGNRYQEFRPFPDGSVGHVAPGSTNTKVQILRVLPCE